MDPQQIDNEQQGLDNNNPNVVQPQPDVRRNRAAFGRRYRDFNLVGSGGFGEVYEARDTAVVEGRTHVAIKEFRTSDRHKLRSFKRELRILKQMGTDNGFTVPFLEYHDNPQNRKKSFLVLGLMWKTLHYVVWHKAEFPEFEESFSLRKVRRLGRQIAEGLQFLEGLDIIHADLKPANIMFANDTLEHLRIIDFGFAFKRTNYNDHSLPKAEYSAMEVFLKLGSYTNAIDIWSFGCILVFMYCAKHLFTTTTDDREKKIVYEIVRTLGMPPRDMITSHVCPTYFKYEDGQWKRDIGWCEWLVEPRSLNIEQFLLLNSKQQPGDDQQEYDWYVDLIKRIVKYDVNTRINIAGILDHDFLKAGPPLL